MQTITKEGICRFMIQESISVDEMSQWSPARISQFFAGFSLILRAYYNTLPPQLPLLQYRPELFGSKSCSTALR